MQNHQSFGPLREAAKAGLGLWVLLSTAQSATADTGRWYTPEQVQRGAGVFAPHCAECHGAAAEATPEWRKPNADGKYPPPPLNGTAHAWHHPLDMLRSTVRKGGVPVGGLMPPFGDKLSTEDIDAAIAFFQSTWPDEIYAAWEERNGKAARLVRAAVPAEASNPITAKLKKRLAQAEIGEPEPTPLPGIFQAKVGSSYAYVTSDGRYTFMGDLVDLEDGTNLTDASRNRDNQALLDAFPEKDMVVYPAAEEEQARITVFTDTSCPYCRKLHQEVPKLQQAGVTVRYVAFPQSGTQGNAYRTMRAVWCADDRRAALDAAKGVGAGELENGACYEVKAVDAGYRLGQKLGVRGTPAIVLPDGSIQPGYMPAAKLLARLGLGAADGVRLSKIDSDR
jgi:thiol:disulfide interchange protein DsbC